MSNLLTRGQVIFRAFNRNIHETKLSDSVIQSAQYKYIKPVLGDDLFDALIADPDNATYATLLELVKEALAWWVKYISLPEIFVEIADAGVKVIETRDTSQVTDQRFIELRESTRVICEDKTKQITDYLEDDDTNMVDYKSSENADHGVSDAGGIIIRRPNTNYEEDCPAKWNK